MNDGPIDLDTWQDPRTPNIGVQPNLDRYQRDVYNHWNDLTALWLCSKANVHGEHKPSLGLEKRSDTSLWFSSSNVPHLSMSFMIVPSHFGIGPKHPASSGLCKWCKGAEANWPSMKTQCAVGSATISCWLMNDEVKLCMSLFKLMLLQVCNNLDLFFSFERV